MMGSTPIFPFKDFLPARSQGGKLSPQEVADSLKKVVKEIDFMFRHVRTDLIQNESNVTNITNIINQGEVDHDLLINAIGHDSHAVIDAHIDDTTIHFTKASIDHTEIQNIGSNSHSTIDIHIADTTIHFTKASIDHTEIQNIGSNSHSTIDSHLSNSGIHAPAGGSDGDHLKTDGDGNLSWEAPPASGGGWTNTIAHGSNPIFNATFASLSRSQFTFYDLDLSSIIGAVSRLVLLRVTCDTPAGVCTVRQNGESGTYSDWTAGSSLNDYSMSSSGAIGYVLTATDSSGIIEFAISNTVATYRIDVVGYI